ncbi:MAG: TetR/AcrR family transcriptional regulator [Patulibacter sp.]|nr:TetR/AcrR family transcriptional regulator [Patulibacter sp.]
MAPTTTPKLSARDRLLDAADELFYAEGVHVVGIDRVIEKAGVAKASLYSAFGSKDELIRAYLERRNERSRERLTGCLEERFATPRERLLGIFQIQGELFADPKFRGCPNASAVAESQCGSKIEQASDDYRGWVRSVFVDLAGQAGAADPEGLAKQLALVHDGAATAARMDRDPAAAGVSLAVATALVDAAIPV